METSVIAHRSDWSTADLQRGQAKTGGARGAREGGRVEGIPLDNCCTPVLTALQSLKGQRTVDPQANGVTSLRG